MTIFRALADVLQHLGAATAQDGDRGDAFLGWICREIGKEPEIRHVALVRRVASNPWVLAASSDPGFERIVKASLERGDTSSVLSELVEGGQSIWVTLPTQEGDNQEPFGFENRTVASPIVCSTHDCTWSLLTTSNVLVSPSDERWARLASEVKALLDWVDDVAQRRLKHTLLLDVGEVGNMGGWIYDPSTGRSSWTDKVAHLHDVDPRSATVDDLLKCYRKRGREALREAARVALRDRGSFDLTLETSSAEGHRKSLRIVGHAKDDARGVWVLRGTVQDVSERRTSGFEWEDGVEFRGQLAAVASGVPCAICSFRLDTDGKFTMPMWNNALRDLLGLAPEHFSMGPERWLANVEPGDAEHNKRDLLYSARTLEPWHAVYPYSHPTLGMRWHEVWAVPSRNHDGSTEWHAFALDVSERKQAEDALRDATERLQNALDAADLGTWRQTMATGEISLDERAMQLFDLDESHVKAEVMLTRCVPEDLERLLTTIRLALSNRTHQGVSIEHRIARRDGSIRWVSNHVKVLYDEAGAPTAAVSTSQDITDAKLAETDLRTSEERYRSLVENIDGLVVITNLDRRINYINQAITRYGYTPEQLQGCRIDEFIHPDDLEHVLQVRKEQLASRGFGPYEFRFREGAGTYRFMRGRSRPLRVANNTVGSIGVLVDLTSQRDTEEQLRAAVKMEAVGRLAGGVAHDFNNLLTVILSYAELAASGLGDDDPVRDDLGEIVEAARRAEGLTRQLLAFSRKQRLQPEVVDPGQVTDGVAKMLRRLIGEDIELSISAQAGLFQVLVDRGQIEQVLVNLVVNARDAMPTGGRVGVGLKNVEVADFLAEKLDVPAGDYVELSVNDTGVGMDADTISHVFEPFFTTKEAGRGTGLGLSMVFGWVKQTHGGITVESEPGTGTTFRIYLPRYYAASDAVAPSQSSDVAQSGSEPVLVVEDENALRGLILRVLKNAGYAVRAVGTPREALAYCASHGGELRLVLTDVVMPEMNGKELADRLAPLCPAARFMFMSGYTPDVLARHGLRDGEVLAKPFDLRTLTRKVREALDTR